MTSVIRLLVVDSSPYVRCLLMSFLEQEPDFQVVGMAHNCSRALSLVQSLQPNVVILSFESSSSENGLAFLDHIMHHEPTPVVVVCSAKREVAMTVLKAIHMGAVDFIHWDTDSHVLLDGLRWEIMEKLRMASRVRVIRSLRSRRKQTGLDMRPVEAGLKNRLASNQPHPAEQVVVIGASTGGPTALRTILSVLPQNFSSAIIVVQHLPVGFTAVLAAQLNRYAAISVREAEHGELLEPGTALVTPGDSHLLLTPESRIRLTKDPAVAGHRPSIDVTMESAACVYGTRTQGVVLTGMGADGAKGLQTIHAKGGTTYAQDSGSCVVDGMPRRARETGIVDYIDTPTQIAQYLIATPQQTKRARHVI